MNDTTIMVENRLTKGTFIGRGRKLDLHDPVCPTCQ